MVDGSKPKVPEGYGVISEGTANVLFPLGNQVFYNPIQELNRDISVLVLKLFIEDFKQQQKRMIQFSKNMCSSYLMF